MKVTSVMMKNGNNKNVTYKLSTMIFKQTFSITSTRTIQVSNQQLIEKTTTILMQTFLKTIGHTPGKGKRCTDKDGTITGCQSVNL